MVVEMVTPSVFDYKHKPRVVIFHCLELMHHKHYTSGHGSFLFSCTYNTAIQLKLSYFVFIVLSTCLLCGMIICC